MFALHWVASIFKQSTPNQGHGLPLRNKLKENANSDLSKSKWRSLNGDKCISETEDANGNPWHKGHGRVVEWGWTSTDDAGFNNKPTDKDGEWPSGSIFRAFYEKATSTPKAPAVRYKDVTLSYTDLLMETKILSEELAQHINQKEAPPLIGVFVHNSPEYVLAILSIMRCSAAFLPLPIDNPATRIYDIIEDSRPEYILTTKEYLNKFNSLGAKMLDITLTHPYPVEYVLLHPTKESWQVSTLTDFVSRNKLDPESVAYVIYTSGSTGKPKGIAVPHRGMVNLAYSQIQILGLDNQDVVGQFASIGFDASISEIFIALLSGATIAIYAKNQRLGEEFVQATKEYGVTKITLPPSLLDLLNPNELPTVKKVITAGEACPISTAMKWHNGGKYIVNGYGPSETTVCATMLPFTRDQRYINSASFLPLGDPLPNVQIAVLDESGNIHTDGKGELIVGGAGVAYGYIGHAEIKNTERFIPVGINGFPTSIWYRTGDLVSWEDGVLHYIGRTDMMVKVRGVRIEVGEIEAAALKYSQVSSATAISKANVLCLYVTPEDVNILSLRAHLAKHLLGSMVPDIIKTLKKDDLPLTPNGKVDRVALGNQYLISSSDMTANEHQKIPLHRSFSRLDQSLELELANMWCKVMDLPPDFFIHSETSFRELGGHSLQLVLLQKEILAALGKSVPYDDLYNANRLSDMAKLLQTDDEKGSDSSESLDQDHELMKRILSDSTLRLDFVLRNKQKDVKSMFGKSVQGMEPKNILLTGATGFIGSHVLYELLESTAATIWCLVRATDEAASLVKLIRCMKSYGLWKNSYIAKLQVIPGDLARPRFSIVDDDFYLWLCENLDVVIANGAYIDFNLGYIDHAPANVFSVQELFSLCVTSKIKSFFYISSLSVFLFPEDATENEHFTENDFIPLPCSVKGGYGQSKWAGERLAQQILHLIPGAIFRPGRVTGRTTDNVGQEDDMFASLVRGVIELGAYPDIKFPFDLVPVDYTSKAIVDISLRIHQDPTGFNHHIFHIYNPDLVYFNELFGQLNLEALSLEQWRERLVNANEPSSLLLRMTPYFMSSIWDLAEQWPTFSNDSTANVLGDSISKLLLPTKVLFSNYVEHFKKLDKKKSVEK